MKYRIFFLVAMVTLISCKRLVEVPSPITSTSAANVYTTNADAAAVLTGIYTNISSSSITNGGISSISLFPSLSADELTLFDFSNSTLTSYYRDALLASNGSSGFWNQTYPVIYVTNAAIEGLQSSSSLTPAIKEDLLGEAMFMRAFCYFYLVNFYGGVPLVTSTDPSTNRVLSRSTSDQVYNQIVSDLIGAQGLLSNNYLARDIQTVTTERTSPTKWAALALLSRVYLYLGDWSKADSTSSLVIGNTSLFGIDSINQTFLKNSTETIWSLQPVLSTPSNTWEGALFILPVSGPNSSSNPVYLTSELVNSFENGDLRRKNWIDSVPSTVVNAAPYYYAYKYENNGSASNVTEYTIVFRLAEQYLIRAEARTWLNNFNGAQQDINVIRSRAGLAGTQLSDQSSLLNLIMQERRVELFTEWGQRWLDLKRTGTINNVMDTICSLKGTIWNPDWNLYPIPQLEIILDPSLVGEQNPGY